MRHLLSFGLLTGLLSFGPLPARAAFSVDPFAAGSVPAVAPGKDAPASTDSAIEASRRAVAAMMARAGVPGVGAAVALDGRIVWAEGFGLADVEQQVAVTRETRFGIGSITKSLTTALAGRLVDAGLLDLDTPIERYLPDFPHPGRGITVRRIAAHLSGLGDDFSTAHHHTSRHFATTDEALREIYTDPLVYEPGTTSAYATGAYTLIAAVVERVSGLPFTEAMDRHVLQPLGLAATVPNDRSTIVPHRTSFYVAGDDGRLQNAPFFDPSYKWAGAGYLSTVEDLARFGSALLKPGFLTGPTLQALFTAYPDASGTRPGFGLGWRVGPEAGFGMSWRVGPDDAAHDVVHQPGGGPGISCWIVLLRDAGLTAVLLANQTGAPVGGRTMDAILEAFLPSRRSP